jgi:hypothetical protein
LLLLTTPTNQATPNHWQHHCQLCPKPENLAGVKKELVTMGATRQVFQFKWLTFEQLSELFKNTICDFIVKVRVKHF